MTGVRLGVGLAMLLALSAPSSGQEPRADPSPAQDASLLTDSTAAVLDGEAAEIAAQLRCPVCTGQSVLESNSGIAQEMQAVIRERLGQGASEDEILDYFVGSYGDWIILKPRAIGLNLLVYILPAGALLLGGAWLVMRIRSWSGSRTTAEGEAPDSGLSDDDERWLREAISRQ
ncbi:MAG: cytochrome c-type biogenesis protein CcmH [Gemmatimonadota bacterium]